MRCACGYGPEWHGGDSGHCPLCACGAGPGEHLPVFEPPAPLLADSYKQLVVCPGKPRTKSGALPTLRRGQFHAPVPAERLREWQGMLIPDLRTTDAPAVSTVPLVSARHTTSLGEICPAAMRLGQKATAAGWSVDPFYWLAADGTETSALVLWRDDLRAFASWDRKPGATWRTAGALGWQIGDRPRTLGVVALAKIVS